MYTDHVLQGTGDKKELLLKPEGLALDHFVVRVKHFGDVFRMHFVLYRAIIIPVVERGEIKGLHCFSFPKAEVIAGAHTVTKDWGVVGDAFHNCVGNPTYT